MRLLITSTGLVKNGAIIRSGGIFQIHTSQRNVRYLCFSLFLSLGACASPDLSERAPVFYNEARTKPVYLMGRLPGPRWQEDNPPKMNARQSFSGYDRYEPCILGLFSKSYDREARMFLRSLSDRLTQVQVKEEPVFRTGEGEWSVISIRMLHESRKNQVRIFALQKFDIVYWVQLTAPDSEKFSLCVPDTETYIQNLWFLYDE